MSVGDVIAIIVCTMALVTSIVTSAIWLCGELRKLALAVANTVTHDQCSQKRDSCPCVKDIEDINSLIDDIHPRKKKEKRNK